MTKKELEEKVKVLEARIAALESRRPYQQSFQYPLQPLPAQLQPTYYPPVGHPLQPPQIYY